MQHFLEAFVAKGKTKQIQVTTRENAKRFLTNAMVDFNRDIGRLQRLTFSKRNFTGLPRTPHVRDIYGVKFHAFVLNVKTCTACLQPAKCCEVNIQYPRKNVAFIAGTFTVSNKVHMSW